ncbi:cobyrinic acid a,c-diamide synthase [Methanoculleus taiwanensis]|uniref:Cobyrinate a,c-diamide synthase n=1 Tax=Methanoculleus taiwanensis TaxID=1550565 RepID=A0A498H4X3_9EURY|nr:cobyrinate a,c-diamide synthase [Methanoculleus taiwanensis]RXE57185.1 cobyrinic acid a,c-diamide synthase [Methanoculleus taiwanensis]
MTTEIPRIVIAGTHSGCGKTTLASGLMAALTARGRVVQPFKVGPDFIDPTHHTAICGRPSRNLDPYMMGREGVRATFAAACRGADIAVIEGVMGLYDGLDGTDEASTADVAKILAAPVILTVDVKGMSRSAHALVGGFAGFDPALHLAGAVFNRVGSPRHRTLIEHGLPLPGLGWLPKRDDLAVASRHLGLAMAIETASMAAFGEVVESACDLDRIEEIAKRAPPLPALQTQSGGAVEPEATIGVARDEAFCFYYRDNLERLTAAGATLRFFSPMMDRLPEVDALYLGGGYPELHAAALSASRCREDVKHAVDDGMPVYAECGGLVYLTERIEGEGRYPMAGVLPARAEMTGRIQGLGYVEARVAPAGTPFFPAGTVFRGHEFHYSRLDCDPDARFLLSLSRGKGIGDGRDGLCEQNAVGQYTHAYFADTYAKALVGAAVEYRRT